MSVKVVMCEEDDFVAMRYYKDEGCLVKDHPPIRGYSVNYCMLIDESTYVKVVDLALTGNRYGLGWNEGWSIFLCQTVLFGVCSGY